jgi:cell division protein ZapA
MDEKNKVVIRICGKDYTIVGNEPEEYIQKVSFYIDKKTREIMSGNPKLSTAMAAVLTSINIADDYFKCNENLENIRKQVQVYADELDKSMTEINVLKREIEELKQNNHSLQIELAKKETELDDFVSSFGNEKR